VSARIRAGLRFERFLCFVLIDVRCLRVSPGYVCPRMKNTALNSGHFQHCMNVKSKDETAPLNDVRTNRRLNHHNAYVT
jgi:hypothetical protein